MGLNNKNTWLDYFDSLTSKMFAPEQLHVEGMERFFRLSKQFHSIFHHSIPVIYLLDYTTGSYMSMSKSVNVLLGYKTEDFMNAGISFLMDNYHKDDFRIYNEQVFADRCKLLKNIPVDEHPNHIFSHNFRIKNIKGDYVSLLQRSCFLKSDKQGNPLITMGMVINMDHYTSNSPIIHIADKINPDGARQNSECIFKTHYYINEEDKLFSKREREVLLWLADGLSSKEVASKLYVSEHTIINHRRSMQNKTNMPNISSLISFAIKNKII